MYMRKGSSMKSVGKGDPEAPIPAGVVSSGVVTADVVATESYVAPL